MERKNKWTKVLSVATAVIMVFMAMPLASAPVWAAQEAPPETAGLALSVSWGTWKGTFWDSKHVAADVTLTNVYTGEEITRTTDAYPSSYDYGNLEITGVPWGFYDFEVSYEKEGDPTVYTYTQENLFLAGNAHKHGDTLHGFTYKSFMINVEEDPDPKYYAFDALGAEDSSATKTSIGGIVKLEAGSNGVSEESTFYTAGAVLTVYVDIAEDYYLKSLKYSDGVTDHTYGPISDPESYPSSDYTHFDTVFHDYCIHEAGNIYEIDFDTADPAAQYGKNNITGIDYIAFVTMPTFNITVTAEFEEIQDECTVTYDVQEDDAEGVPEPETVDYDEYITEPVDPTLDGYFFGGWYTDAACTGGKEWVFDEDTLTSDVTLYAQWLKLCTVTFLDGEGKTLHEDKDALEGGTIAAPDEPERDGYLFKGWYTDEECTNTNKWDFDNDFIEDDLILYSGWIKGWIVNFYDWDGTELGEYKVEEGDASPAPADPGREGYTFTGWDTDFSSVTENLEVNAEYEINRYTVVFKDWDGAILKTQENVPYSVSATAPVDPSRTGHRFSGWDADFSSVTSDLTVTAQYVLTHTVTFDSAGGGEVDEQIINHGGKADNPDPAPVKGGYILEGWYEEDSLENKWDFDSDTVLADVTLYAKWTAQSSGGGGSGGGDKAETKNPTISKSESSTAVVASATITPSNTSAGTATASLTSSDASTLLENAKTAEAEGKKAVVEIKIAPSDNTVKTAVTIPNNNFNELSGGTDADLRVDSGIGTVTFDSKSVEEINTAAANEDITISIEKVDSQKLSDEVKEIIKGRPVYDFSVTAGETQVSSFGGNVRISLPYTLGEGENPNSVVVYYIDDSGGLQTVRGAFDEETGTVNFSTDHFSVYMIGYNNVSFSDVAQGAWYHDAVGFIAARGITAGTGDGRFNPNAALTRGQFLVMLMKAYGVEADENPEDNFADAGDAYYTDYLATAKRLGITAGVGDNLFEPDKKISRQDMFTLIFRSLDTLGELPGEDSGKTLSDFSDSEEIADYATESMETLISNGIISGNNGELNPGGYSTRAQLAQVLYHLLSGN